MKTFLTAALLLISGFPGYAAAHFSYLYIQGDKQTPFYVKLEGGMQPRYGKNYCIIPKLAPGPAHIEILFQQNAQPSRTFTVLIPEGGSRGFLLVKLDNGYSLYDLQQGFYLPAGNKAEDDRMPVIEASLSALSAQPENPVRVTPPEIPQPQAAAKADPSPQKSARKARDPLFKKQQPASRANEGDGNPEFISGIELSQGARRDSGSLQTGRDRSDLPVIVNTDCPAAISSAEFGKIFSALARYEADEDKLEFFAGKLDLCYETWQARTLAGRLQSDVARYELLRKIYPRISDQGAFPLLDDLLTSEVWKAEFNRLVHR